MSIKSPALNTDVLPSSALSASGTPLDLQVLQQAQQWASTSPVWLCTVLHTWGSAPRGPGAMLAVSAEGAHCGSLSGGCVEEDLLARLASGQWQAPSQVIRYGDGELTANVKLPCGGILAILIEYLPAGDDTVAYLARQVAAIAGHEALHKRLTLPHPCQHLAPADFSTQPQVKVQGNEIDIRMSAAPQLLVAGYSPVAQYCMSFAFSLGFEVILCEPREDVLATLQGDSPINPLPPGVRVLETLPAHYLQLHGCHANTAIVALTHDPRLDDLTMMEAVKTPAFYIGVMGSAQNSRHRRERLTRIGQLSDAEQQRIHAPIGLAIGSKTPAEIGLAIMADIVRLKNCG